MERQKIILNQSYTTLVLSYQLIHEYNVSALIASYHQAFYKL
jgi:hypothetical protein